jgi:hypothetical protein
MIAYLALWLIITHLAASQWDRYDRTGKDFHLFVGTAYMGLGFWPVITLLNRWWY